MHIKVGLTQSSKYLLNVKMFVSDKQLCPWIPTGIADAVVIVLQDQS
jgi:hypothetical protein